MCTPYNSRLLQMEFYSLYLKNCMFVTNKVCGKVTVLCWCLWGVTWWLGGTCPVPSAGAHKWVWSWASSHWSDLQATACPSCPSSHNPFLVGKRSVESQLHIVWSTSPDLFSTGFWALWFPVGVKKLPSLCIAVADFLRRRLGQPYANINEKVELLHP